MAYSLNFASCIFTIADNDGNLIKEYDLPNVEVFFDDQYITCKDIDTEWSLHISELSDVDSGAYATFDDMRDVIVAQKVACVSSGGGTETTTTMGALINSATTATPNNSDYVATAESGGVLKKISWTNVKAFLKTYFDTIYTTTSAVASQITTAISGKLDANTPITGATKTKITYDSDGLITSGADATTDDIAEGVTNLYWSNTRTINSVLTGLSVTGSTIVSTDSILQALGKAQNQINSLVGGVNYQGNWNANTNSPSLASGVGTKGYYYVVSLAGSTNLDGITDWKLGDWAIYNGTAWQKIDNTDAVISVNGYTGIVTLTTADISDSTNKRYVTDAELVVIGNTSGTNSGNETTSTIGSLLNGSGSATPNDTDIVATAESSVLKKITWTSIKAFLKTYFDTKYTKYLLKTATDGTNVTGVTADTLTYSGLIPANSVSVGDVLRFFSFTEYTGTTSNRRARAYINTSASLSGATLLASTPNATGTTRTIAFDRYLGVKSSSVTRVHSATALDYAGTTNSTNVWSSANIDWTVDQYFIISIQLANATDAGLSSFLTLEKI